MPYKASKKQAAAHKAFMVDKFKRGVLLMGRQCLAPDTLVRTNKGLIPIGDLAENDLVASYSKQGRREFKKVINKWEYGVEVDPKPMLAYYYDNQKISSTYDHPFWYKGHFIPIYQLAWRNMEASQREKLELLCKQYGQTLDYEAIWRLYDGSDEAWLRRFGLSAYSGGRQDDQDAQTSSPDLGGEPRKQTPSKSQELQSSRQSGGKSGVDNSSGEHSTHPQSRESSQQAGRKLRNSYFERSSSIGYSGGQENPTGNSEGLQGLLVYRSGHPVAKDLVSYLTVSECAPTVSIEVEDNHNYCITPEDILVANSGKTFFATQHSWISATIKQGRYFVVFKTYKQAHEVVWRQYVPLIPKELIYKKNESDLLIELHYHKDTPITLPSGEEIMVNHDTSKPRSTIQLLGSDQSDSHRGFKADGMIFDEYADQDPNNFEIVYEPMFSTTNGWIIFMGTPRGYNHFYDLIQFAKEEDDWFYQEATWRDSPHVSTDFMRDVKARAIKRGMLSGFMQEYELEFRSVQGAVFPVFDRKVHVITPDKVPEDLTYYAAIDFGWHTTAFLLVGIDKDQNWYIVDEVYGKEETLDNVIPRIKNKIGDKRIVLMVGDSANRDAIEVMGRSFPMVGVNKANDTKGYQLGIGLITEKLKPRMQLVGLPKPQMFMSSACKHLIYEIESYRFPEEKAGRNPSDIPIKEDDHGPDALRYLMLHLKFGLHKEEKIPKAEIEKVTNQYGLI